MSIKKFSLLVPLLLASAFLTARPYNPDPYVVDNCGEEIRIQHIGDEHYSFFQTTDGHLIDKDSVGCFRYLNEYGLLSNILVRNHLAVADSLYLRQLDLLKVRDAHRRLHPDKHVFLDEGEHKPQKWAVGAYASDKPSPMRMPSGKNSMGADRRFPVILVSGQNSKNCNASDMHDMLNMAGYTKNNHHGSVRDYFKSTSNGQFVPNYDIYSVSVGNVLTSYNGNEGKLVKEAIDQLKTMYPDFNANQYDSDNDGEIDAVAILYAGTEEQADYLGGFAYHMQWEPQGVQWVGKKKFNTFFILSQMSSNTRLAPICNFVHEFSHCLGLKDHYSVQNYPETFTTQFPGSHGWDVMSTGMYNNGGGCPPGYSAFEKEFMGWISPTPLVETDGTTVVKPLNTTQQAYKLTISENECFYLENRQLTGWDSSLPNHGLLIWHIDYDQQAWEQDVMNDVEDHQRIDVVEAGNLPVTDYYDGFSKDHLVDDTYPGSQNVTFFDRFRSWSGRDMGIRLYQITEENNNIYFATKQGVDVVTSDQEPTEYLFGFDVDLTLSDAYKATEVDMTDVLDSLQVGNDAVALYSMGLLKEYAVEPDGKKNGNMTAIEPGQWFDANGQVVSYADGYVFAEYDLAEKKARVGHYPGRVKANEKFVVSQAFVVGNKTAIVNYNIMIKDSVKTGVETVSLPLMLNVGNDNVLRVNTQVPGTKTISVMDASGIVLYQDSFVGTDAVVVLDKGLSNKVLFVVVESVNGTRLCKGFLNVKR